MTCCLLKPLSHFTKTVRNLTFTYLKITLGKIRSLSQSSKQEVWGAKKGSKPILMTIVNVGDSFYPGNQHVTVVMIIRIFFMLIYYFYGIW